MVWPNITAQHTTTSTQFGGDQGNKLSDYFNDIDLAVAWSSTDEPKINTITKIRTGKLKIGDASNNNWVTITNGEQTADRNLAIPVLVGNDTMATLGVAQTFTDDQTISDTAFSDVFNIRNNANSVNDNVSLNLQLRDSANNAVNYGRINAQISDPTNGSEDGRLRFYVRQADVLNEIMRLEDNGKLHCGGPNRRIAFDETGLTAIRTFTYPDADTKVAGLAIANLFTDAQTIKKDTNSGHLSLYRQINSIGTQWSLLFEANDSASNQTTYASLTPEIADNTNGSEDGILRVNVMIAGGVTNTASWHEDGHYRCGGSNRRVDFAETGLTTVRSFKFPNADTTLIGTGTQSGATVDINTNNTEQDMLNYSVPANSMGANGCVRFTISGYLLQNQATGTTYIFRIKFGGTNMWEDTSASIAQSANKMAFRFTGEVFNKNATNANGASGFLTINEAATTATTGVGDIQDDEIQTNAPVDSDGADTTKDTTSAQTLQVTVTMSVSNAAVHTVIKHKMVEVVTFA
jgi:hypothetical protein